LPRQRFQSGKRPIVSNKEVLDFTNITVAAGVTTDNVVAIAVNDYAGTVGTCPLGSTILGFYIEASAVDVSGSGLSHRIDWLMGYVKGNVPVTSLPTPANSGGNVLRSNVLHEEKGIFPSTATVGEGKQQVRTRSFVRIPKSLRRMNEGKQWVIRSGSSGAYSTCYKVIYKWYT